MKRISVIVIDEETGAVGVARRFTSAEEYGEVYEAAEAALRGALTSFGFHPRTVADHAEEREEP
jgi:hypothetical protein